MKTISIHKRIVLAIGICLGCYSCDFLDVIPDDVPTIDHAFDNRYEAEGFLYGCFAFQPNPVAVNDNPVYYGGDEAWLDERNTGLNQRMWRLAKGEQGTNPPLYDCGASRQLTYDLNGGSAYFTAIRDCNIFLENIHKPYDLEDYEREVWIADIKFIKAYYHFLLMRQYGAVPVIRENAPVSAGTSEISMYREPVDSVVKYICELVDEALPDLPMVIEDRTLYMGMPTKPMALALKAQALTWAASPLFNGNEDYAKIKDSRGYQLFPQEKSREKWEKAAEALKEAIDTAHVAGHRLFNFRMTNYATNLNDQTVLTMNVRGAVVERWNDEMVWGNSATDPTQIQQLSFPVFFNKQNDGHLYRCYAPPLHIVEQFYTKNGVPIEEDKEWQNVNPLEIVRADAAHKSYIQTNKEVPRLHMNREARFYGAISFDGSRYYGNSRITDENTVWYVGMLNGDPNGGAMNEKHSVTGYQAKKLVHYLSSVSDETSNTRSMHRYPFPIVRLADLYLMYAEALNEAKSVPDEEVYEYIDKVRERSGLKGVVESWREYTDNPSKPATQAGMRDIIQRERLNELAFEGHRFWDLRRWKKAEEHLDGRVIYGLNITAETVADHYKPVELYRLSFQKKDYLWPIRQNVLMKNDNLVQNLDW